jgi:hypothetical protein
MVAISLSGAGEGLDGKSPGLQRYCATSECEEQWFQGTCFWRVTTQSLLTTVWPASQGLASAHQEIAILVHCRLIARMHQGRRIEFFNNGWSRDNVSPA